MTFVLWFAQALPALAFVFVAYGRWRLAPLRAQRRDARRPTWQPAG